MKVELLGRVLSALPEDDDHPYRTGPWRPQTSEWSAPEPEVIGEIPTDLDGLYLRNTENPVHPAVRMYHPFDGDGMVHMAGFRDGKVFYRNRFVRTEGFEAERDAGRSLWAGLAENPAEAPRQRGWGARGTMKDASSTDVVVHAGVALTSFYQCGDMYRLDPLTLDTLGRASWHGKFPSDVGVSAHPKVDEHTGEMMFFNYIDKPPYMHYGVVDAEDRLVTYVDVPLPGPRVPHDMAFTENYAILNDCPLFSDAEAIARGSYAPRFHREIPTRIGLIPRHGTTEQIRWFEADPTFVLHWVNAYEDGDEVVLDGFFQDNPVPAPRVGASAYDNIFRFLGLDGIQPHLHRWRLNLSTGLAKEERLTDSITEFGMVNGRHGGRRHRYAYAASGVPNMFLFDGLVKHDIDRGTEERYMLGEGVFGSETAMAPRVGATAEDDGYLIMFTTDMVNDRSECLVLDAARVSDGPIARIRLPERISSGTHSTWAPGSDLPGWRSSGDPAAALRL